MYAKFLFMVTAKNLFLGGRGEGGEEGIAISSGKC